MSGATFTRCPVCSRTCGHCRRLGPEPGAGRVCCVECYGRVLQDALCPMCGKSPGPDRLYFGTKGPFHPVCRERFATGEPPPEPLPEPYEDEADAFERAAEVKALTGAMPPVSTSLQEQIDADPEAFEARVSTYRYAAAMEAIQERYAKGKDR